MVKREVRSRSIDAFSVQGGSMDSKDRSTGIRGVQRQEEMGLWDDTGGGIHTVP